jgi:hypothetical protein
MKIILKETKIKDPNSGSVLIVDYVSKDENQSELSTAKILDLEYDLLTVEERELVDSFISFLRSKID